MDYKKIDMGELGRQLFAKILKATASDGKYTEILEECNLKKEKFTDESFPPNEFSLINDWDEEADGVPEKARKWNRFTWIRATDIPELNDEEGKLQVFANKIEPNDIKQGDLGDCYFLSILSVLAEKEKRIRNLFVSERQTQWGVYGMRICKNGEWKDVVVDDFIPCDRQQVVFSAANENELWVILLEKAWAKLHGSYERIEAGFAENVMRDLTGAPTEVIECDEEKLWDSCSRADKEGWIMAASAGNGASADALEELGLIGYHAYGLIGCVEINDRFGDPVQLFQLRNPWGDFEWQGDWGDKSDDWTDQSKRQAGWTDADDGTFFMCIDDIRKYFSRVQICRINDNYQYSFFKARHKLNSFALIRFVVNAPGGHHYLTVNQTDERCFDRKINYDYSNVRLIVAKIENPDDEEKVLTYMNGKQGQDRDTWEEYENLEPGEYYMFVEFDWPDNVQHTEFSVSCYGEAKTYFLRDEKSIYDKNTLITNLMASCAVQEHPENSKLTTFDSQGAPEIKKYFAMTEEGYGYVHIVNGDAESRFKEKVEYTKFDRLSLLKPFKGDSYEVDVGPGESKTVVIRQNDPTGFSMASRMRMQAVIHGPKQLINMCVTQGKETRRNHSSTKKPLEIYQYMYKHQAGIAYYYMNNEDKITLKEELHFALTGLQIEGNADGDSSVSFTIGPGQTKLIELKSIGAQWKIGLKMGYSTY